MLPRVLPTPFHERYLCCWSCCALWNMCKEAYYLERIGIGRWKNQWKWEENLWPSEAKSPVQEVKHDVDHSFMVSPWKWKKCHVHHFLRRVPTIPPTCAHACHSFHREADSYFPPPWVWAGLMASFDQEKTMEVMGLHWDFWVKALRDLVASTFTFLEASYHIKKLGLDYNHDEAPDGERERPASPRHSSPAEAPDVKEASRAPSWMQPRTSGEKSISTELREPRALGEIISGSCFKLVLSNTWVTETDSLSPVTMKRYMPGLVRKLLMWTTSVEASACWREEIRSLQSKQQQGWYQLWQDEERVDKLELSWKIFLDTVKLQPCGRIPDI